MKASCKKSFRISGPLLPLSFYRRLDVVRISRELLGQYVFSRIGSCGVTGGRIVETEAYAGVTDRASHAYGNRLTPRTEVMYLNGGVAYVYLCYGMHALFNIITAVETVPHAVLIRAIEPTHGIALMRRRRERCVPDGSLASGPGNLARALGISVKHSGESLIGDTIWLERGKRVPPSRIQSRVRVGVDYAGEDAALPWRFIASAAS